MAKSLLTCACVFSLSALTAMAQENKANLPLAGGKLELTAPANWERVQPRTRIVEHEFAVPAAEGDAAGGRLTVMAAGGGVDANLKRWYDQFTQPDGTSTEKRAKLTKKNLAGQEIHLVDIWGTFRDQRGPMAPAVERPKYRLLGAIIATRSMGDYFIKLTGPERTIAENEQAFLEMIESLQGK